MFSWEAIMRRILVTDDLWKSERKIDIVNVCLLGLVEHIGHVPFDYFDQDINRVKLFSPTLLGIWLMPELVKDLTENWWYEHFSGKMSFLWSCKFVAVLWLIWIGRTTVLWKKVQISVDIASLQLWIVPS